MFGKKKKRVEIVVSDPKQNIFVYDTHLDAVEDGRSDMQQGTEEIQC